MAEKEKKQKKKQKQKMTFWVMILFFALAGIQINAWREDDVVLVVFATFGMAVVHVGTFAALPAAPALAKAAIAISFLANSAMSAVLADARHELIGITRTILMGSFCAFAILTSPVIAGIALLPSWAAHDATRLIWAGKKHAQTALYVAAALCVVVYVLL